MSQMDRAPPVDRLGLQRNRAQVALLQQCRAQMLKRSVCGSRRACPLICSQLTRCMRTRGGSSNGIVIQLDRLKSALGVPFLRRQAAHLHGQSPLMHSMQSVPGEKVSQDIHAESAHHWVRASTACACGSASCPGTPQSPAPEQQQHCLISTTFWQR